MKQFLKNAAKLTSGTAIQILIPWFDQIINIKLIGTPYKTEITTATSIVGTIVFWIAFALLKDKSIHEIQKNLRIAAAFLLISFIITFGFQLSMGTWLNLGPGYLEIAWLIWALFFLVIFGSLAVVIADIAFLIK